MPQSNDAIAPPPAASIDKDDILDILEAPDKEQEEGAEGAQPGKEATPPKQKKAAPKEGEAAEEDLITDEELDTEEEEPEKIPEVEELNLVTPVRRKEILAKYPNVFKDFPYLEQAYYREQHFTEIFPTLDDAKEASSKSEILDNFESDLMQGNISKVLGAVKNNDPEAFNKLADNYLQELGRVDTGAVHHVIGNIIKNSVINVINEAIRMGENGEPLKEAAILFHQAIFGTTQIQTPTTLSKKQDATNSDEERLNKERTEFARQKFEDARDTLNGKVQNSIKSTIANHIDPKSSMTDYVRKNAIRDAHENLESMMGQDARFTKLMDVLWRKAFENNFSQKSIDTIRSTYLSKARTLLPSVIQKYRNEALRSSKTSKEDKDRKGPLPPGRASTSSRATSSPKEIPKDMSTLDFLNSD